MFEVKVSVDAVNLRKTLKVSSRRIKIFQPPLTDSGKLMVKSVDRNFAEQGRPRRWARLSPTTLRMRRSSGNNSARILQSTGALRRSIRFRLVGGTSVEVGTNKTYGAYHQAGYVGGFGNRKVPARPFLVFQKVDVTRIQDIFTKHIEKAVKT